MSVSLKFQAWAMMRKRWAAKPGAGGRRSTGVGEHVDEGAPPVDFERRSGRSTSGSRALICWRACSTSGGPLFCVERRYDELAVLEADAAVGGGCEDPADELEVVVEFGLELVDPFWPLVGEAGQPGGVGVQMLPTVTRDQVAGGTRVALGSRADSAWVVERRPRRASWVRRLG